MFKHHWPKVHWHKWSTDKESIIIQMWLISWMKCQEQKLTFPQLKHSNKQYMTWVRKSIDGHRRERYEFLQFSNTCLELYSLAGRFTIKQSTWFFFLQAFDMREVVQCLCKGMKGGNNKNHIMSQKLSSSDLKTMPWISFT